MRTRLSAPRRSLRSWLAPTTRRLRSTLFVSATLLVSVVAGCATRTEVILLEPPDLPPDAFEEMLEGQCPLVLEWYWERYDPWLEKLHEAQVEVD